MIGSIGLFLDHKIAILKVVYIGLISTFNVMISLSVYHTQTVLRYYNCYRIAQNVGGVKLWRNHSTRVIGR